MAMLNERLAVVARIAPQAITAAATEESDGINMKYFRRVLFVFNMGDYAAGNDGSVEVKITGGTDNASFATDLTGKTLTTALFTGSAGDDAVGIIEVSAEECAAQDVTYIRAEITPTDQNLTCGLVALGADMRYSDSADYDLDAITEIIE